MEKALNEFWRFINEADKVLVFTGAGISTLSGSLVVIKDLRT